MLTLTNILSVINQAFLQNVDYCFIKKTKSAEQILICLREAGLLISFHSDLRGRFIVHLKKVHTTGQSTKELKLKLFSKPTRLIHASAYTLKALAWRHRRSLLLVSTPTTQSIAIASLHTENNSLAGGLVLGLIIPH